MVTILTKPVHRLTVSGAVYENELLIDAKVIRRENGFDMATIIMDNEGYACPTAVTAGSPVTLEVTNEGDTYPTNPMFNGVVRFPVAIIEKQRIAFLSCDGAGYGLGQMLVGEEYGTQSTNPGNDTITEIINGPSYGIVPQFVNRVFKAGAEGSSGFNYNVADVDTIADVIQYIDFPYKPANQCFNDLVDLVTALKAGGVGPHWIVTTDNHIRLKLVNGTQAGWTKYFGDSQEAATLTFEEDIERYNLEPQGPEANYILFYGAWRRPSNGDAWTNNRSGDWNESGLGVWGLVDDTTTKRIGTYSLKLNFPDGATGGTAYATYPKNFTAGWDFESAFQQFNVPSLNFYARRTGAVSAAKVFLSTNPATLQNYYQYSFFGDLVDADKWYHISLPIGPYFPQVAGANAPKWTVGHGSPNWAIINGVQIYALVPSSSGTGALWVDGLHFGGAAVCRVAYNSGISPYSMRLITDEVGKDDSLKGCTCGLVPCTCGSDSGLMAQLAYAELLRCQKSTFNLTVTTHMLHEALPGQWFYVNAEDMRATEIIQQITGTDYTSEIHLTDDLTNGRVRMRYEDLNKQWESIRPEFQDRQASSIKAGQVNWRVPRLSKAYV